MEIREAHEADIPAIVDLLKLSLGEGLMQKSEQYWRWKHQQNPFGASPVLVCFEGKTLVGVRAFMRWEWKHHDKIYKALRAVDTATHPDFQGKGIFKKLTLALIDLCKSRNDDFIFNTPNEQSKPGYLKMGWEEAGKLPVALSVQRPFAIMRNLMGRKDGTKMDGGNLAYYLQHPGVGKLIQSYQDSCLNISTNMSLKYLKWRYQHVPVAEYMAVGSEENSELSGLIFGRIKLSKLGRELRITDCLLSDAMHGKLLLAKLHDLRKAAKIDYCTFSGACQQNIATVLGRYHLRLSVGPTVTVRNLTMDDLHPLKNFNEWSPALGDLELF